MRIQVNPNPRCYRTYGSNFRRAMLKIRTYRKIFQESLDYIDRIGSLLLKIFEARTEKLEVEISPSLVKNRLMLHKLAKALSRTTPDYFTGTHEILNKAFNLFENNEVATKMKVRFSLINSNEVAATIWKTHGKRTQKVNEFIIDSPHPERIGKPNKCASETGLAELLEKTRRLHFPEK